MTDPHTTDPYTSLARELLAAAERQASPRGRRFAWVARLRRAPVAAIAAMLVLVGGAVAIAATGLLEGAPVKPEVQRSPVRANGLPLAGQGRGLLARVADPAGGLPWGLRVLRTTRGQVCLQVGRVEGSRLGELGTDSAFGDDGRFHALAADILPPGYGGSSGQVDCVASGVTLVEEDAEADRNAVRLLPEEFPDRPRGPQVTPPTANLRTLAYGVLGPHAVSVTFRTPHGLQTVPVNAPQGSFLIVEPGGYIKGGSLVGGGFLGEASPHSVSAVAPSLLRSRAIVTAATFRFGGKLCSQGAGGPVHARCPTVRTHYTRASLHPIRDLHREVELSLLRQSPSACRAAYLLDPCYKGQLQFQAPYAVASATHDYTVQSFAHCRAGGRPETGWSLERDVKAGETIRTTSLGLFVLTPRCLAHEGFEVQYGPTFGAPGGQRAPVILGKVLLSEARIPSAG